MEITSSVFQIKQFASRVEWKSSKGSRDGSSLDGKVVQNQDAGKIRSVILAGQIDNKQYLLLFQPLTYTRRLCLWNNVAIKLVHHVGETAYFFA